MQGLITLDFGNSHPHAGIFIKNKLGWKLEEVTPIDHLDELIERHTITPHNTQIAISQVKPYPEIEKKLFEKGYLITNTLEYWRGKKFCGLPVNYSESLGQDRLIQSFYGYRLKVLPLVILDAGTFTTIDIITDEGFRGGYILPSFESYSSLFKKGENLKNIDLKLTYSKNIPQSTEAALISGYQSFQFLIKNIQEEFQIKKIILTGGKAEDWRILLPNLVTIIEHQPHFIHHALHHWWTTQVELL
jgi:pantothenate kinase type III